MRAKSETRVSEAAPFGAHLKHWEGAQVLLAVIRNGSLRKAADAMSLPVIVARRRIESFEREIGASLFVRDGRGTRLTREGEQVLAAVERMEVASLDLLRTQNSALQSLAGPVRLRTPDSIGSFWLAPRMAEFQRAFPRILFDFDCAPRFEEMLRPTDVALTFERPLLGSEHVKVARVHSMLFASQRYLDTFGAPASPDELLNHRLLLQAADATEVEDLVKQWFPLDSPDDLLTMRCTASSAHYFAIAQGVGLGPLPTYLRTLGSNLIALDIGLKQSAEVWLSWHPESNRYPRVRRTIDWLRETFNRAKFPWFRDEFLHPDQLEGLSNGANSIKLFENCLGGGR